MSRKQEIIDASVRLFNEQGTKAVSTNHIAAELGISPGNLYYYFKNKEEIIREIFAQMDREGMDEYSSILAEHPLGTLETLEITFMMIQRFNWKYRFFKRELTAILMGDKHLHGEYVKVHKNMLAVTRMAVTGSIEAKVLRTMSEEEINLFTEELWMLMIFWLNYLEIGGEEVSDETLKRGNDVLRNAILSRRLEP